MACNSVNSPSVFFKIKASLEIAGYDLQMYHVRQACGNYASDEMTRMKGIDYRVDKQVGIEDMDCFPSEKAHMAKTIRRNERHKISHLKTPN